MEGLGVAANVIAVVDLSAKVATACFHYVKEVKGAKEDISRLIHEVIRLRDLSEEVQTLLGNGAGLQTSLKLKDAVREGQRTLEHMNKRLGPLNQHQTMKMFGSRALKWPFKRKEIEKHIQDLQRCSSALHLALQVDQTVIILTLEQKALMDQLSVAAGAPYNSRAEEHNALCQPNTRTDLLQQFDEWIDKSSSKKIFWLNGMAGTGKSTISRTVSKSSFEKDYLGASFFFKKGEADRGNASKFASTIARQLVQQSRSFASKVKEEIDNDPSITSYAGLGRQFNQLILKPLSEVAFRNPLVIVLDALDECEGDSDIRLIITLLSQMKLLKPSKLRVFVTSRPELPIRLGFNTIKESYQDLILHEIPSHTIEHDIRIYFESELRKVKNEWNDTIPDSSEALHDWPASADVERLVKMAVPLFIFAATATRFISDARLGSPEQQLRELLTYKGANANQLDATYRPILNRLLVDIPTEKQHQIKLRFQRIVGTIVSLETPLSVSGLSRLMAVPTDSVYSILNFLHSVLDVPVSASAPVRLLHLSFRDFLTDPSKSGAMPLWVNEKESHRKIAEACLCVMENLKYDICGVRHPGTKKAAIEKNVISTHLPSELQYSCRYWVIHLERVGLDDSLCKLIAQFLNQHFLHWIEALILIECAEDIINLLERLSALVESSQDLQLWGLVEEVSSLVTRGLPVIDKTPLQIYQSLLLFAPPGSEIGLKFSHQVPSWVFLKISSAIEQQFPDSLYHVEHAPAYPGFTPAFSADSKYVAIAEENAAGSSQPHSVRVFRCDTGQIIKTFLQYPKLLDMIWLTDPLRLVMVSLDPRTLKAILSAFSPHTDIWERPCSPIRITCDRISTCAIDPAGILLFTAYNWINCYVRIWCLTTGKLVEESFHSSEIHSFSFSPDGKLVAIRSVDGVFRIYEILGGLTKCLLQATCSRHSRASPVFSHNSTLLVTVSFEQEHLLNLWALEEGGLLRVVDCSDHMGGHKIGAFAFSPNSEQIAVGGHPHGHACILEVGTGKWIACFSGGIKGKSLGLSFSPDSRLLAAVGQFRGTLVFSVTKNSLRWNQTRKITKTERITEIDDIRFSFDLSIIISTSSGIAGAKTWSVDNAELVAILDVGAHIEVAPNSEYFLCIQKNTFRIHKMQSSQCMYTFQEPEGYSFLTCFFSPDSTKVISTSKTATGYTYLMWHLGRINPIIISSNDQALECIFSPNSAFIFGKSPDSFRLWDTNSGERTHYVQSYQDFDDKVKTAIFSPDSAFIAVIYFRKKFKRTLFYIYDLAASGTSRSIYCKGQSTGDEHIKAAMCFSYDIKLLAIWSEKDPIQLWDLEHKACIAYVDVKLPLRCEFVAPMFEFDVESSVVHTVRGSFDLNEMKSELLSAGKESPGSRITAPRSQTPMLKGLGFTDNLKWITWNGKGVIAIPSQYHPRKAIVKGSSIVIGCYERRGFLLFRFSLKELEERFD